MPRPKTKSARGIEMLMTRENDRIEVYDTPPEGPEPNEPPDTPIDTPSEPEAELSAQREAGRVAAPEGGAANAPQAAMADAQAQDTSTPPPPEPTLQLPIALALPEQTRRVREQVLPAWYAHRYNPESPIANDPAVAALISDINAALSAADHAMMTQDVGLMIFTYRILERFQT